MKIYKLESDQAKLQTGSLDWNFSCWIDLEHNSMQGRALQWKIHLNTAVTMVYIIMILEYGRYGGLPL